MKKILLKLTLPLIMLTSLTGCVQGEQIVETVQQGTTNKASDVDLQAEVRNTVPLVVSYTATNFNKDPLNANIVGVSSTEPNIILELTGTAESWVLKGTNTSTGTIYSYNSVTGKYQ